MYPQNSGWMKWRDVKAVGASVQALFEVLFLFTAAHVDLQRVDSFTQTDTDTDSFSLSAPSAQIN